MRLRIDGERRRAWHLGVVLIAAAVTSGCITKIVAPYSGMYGGELNQLEEESAPYQKKGSGTISGTVTIDTPSGPIIASEGTQVYLTPATTLAYQRLQDDVIEDNDLPDRVQAELVVIVRTDSHGRFRFAGLVGGSYILASAVVWGDDGGGEPRKDVAYGIVDLATGEHAVVTITRQVGTPGS